MSFAALPREAAWQHRGARAGFEVVFFDERDGGCLIHGCTAAIEDGTPWTVEYAIELDSAGATRSARISGRSAAGPRSALLEADGAGRWLVNGQAAPLLDGCLDVDLESSAMTNALPVRGSPWRSRRRHQLPPPTSARPTWPWTGWSRATCAPPARAQASAMTTPLPPLISNAA